MRNRLVFLVVILLLMIMIVNAIQTITEVDGTLIQAKIRTLETSNEIKEIGIRDPPRNIGNCDNIINTDGTYNIDCFTPLDNWVCDDGVGGYECRVDKCIIIDQINGVNSKQSRLLCGEYREKYTYTYEPNGRIMIIWE